MLPTSTVDQHVSYMALSGRLQGGQKSSQIGVAAPEKHVNELDVLVNACGLWADVLALQVPDHFDRQQFIAQFVRFQ